MKKSLVFLLSFAILTTAFVGHTFATTRVYNVADFAEPFSSIIKVKATVKRYIQTYASGAVEHSYEMVDITSTMDPEENKVAEYMVSNIALKKGQVLKAYSSDNVYYDDFAHKWSNVISKDGDGNYVVPMTSNSYSFYLKYYSDNSTQLYITANKDILFFEPSGGWKSDGARFAANLYNNDAHTQQWKDFNETSKGSGVYKVDLGEFATLNIVRMNPATSINDWSNKWNQSGDLSIANYDTNNCIANTDWDNWTASYNSTWSSR